MSFLFIKNYLTKYFVTSYRGCGLALAKISMKADLSFSLDMN